MGGSLKAAREDRRFQFFLARLLGQLVEGKDGEHVITGYLWRGVLYATSVRPRTD